MSASTSSASAEPSAPPTWGRLLADAGEALGDRQEARWLLEEVAGSSWASLRARLDELAPRSTAQALRDLVARRRAGEPLQHVVGHWSFRRLELLVDRRALVPRPETELVVEHALAALDERARTGGGRRTLRAGDLGTGGGAIACCLAAERRDVEVVATDRSSAALELASANVARLGAEAASRIRLVPGDWYEALRGEQPRSFDVLVSNPPYLAEAEWEGLDPVVRDHDPYESLIAGPSGLEAIAVLTAGAGAVLVSGGSLVLEIAPHQAQAALELAERGGASGAVVEADLAGRARVLVARW